SAVDISFFPEDPFALDGLAREKGATTVVDCGVAPGASNLLVGHVAALLDSVSEVSIFVGGLPVQRFWPFEYRAPFSPVDVIEEYTRPARLVENGKVVVKPALSELEQLDFAGIGTLEAFNTDGLRTLLRTVKAKNMREKTLRYPGHAEKIRLLRDSGFFSREEVKVGQTSVRPLDLTARLLFDQWRFREGEEDLTVMRVQVEGTKGGRKYRYRYDLLDRYDPQTGLSSMARTTGFTASVTVRLLLEGKFSEPGIVPPEFLGRDEAAFRFILDELRKRNVQYREQIEELDAA
ncbi:MAG TPA: saccharopine dehydrogenase, partial [Bacteroidetes bacterium]|nr:saccharopine dehydrogenase [Bacteroidota bacterium]